MRAIRQHGRAMVHIPSRAGPWRGSLCGKARVTADTGTLRCSPPPEIPLSHYTGPLLTRPVAAALCQAHADGAPTWQGSLDLGRQVDTVQLAPTHWQWRNQHHPYPGALKDRTIYYRDGDDYAPVARFAGSLIKLVPTQWGVPTFEIDGIKMLPTAKASPLDDARRKVALVAPQGKVVLDTCGGLGYFAACCLEAGATRIHSFEKNPDVLWLRTLNPWSPDPQAAASGGRLQLQHADVAQAITQVADASVDALLHDPPRFGIAGELYAQAFYTQLARVLRRGGRLFHYTGSPNRLTSGRDVPREVARRLDSAGFKAELALDGVFAVRR